MLSLLTKEQQERIQYVSIDLTSSAEQITGAFQQAKVDPDHVFFFGYLYPKGKSAMSPEMADALV
jgi:NAD(P)H-hydrate repair Nnr-like enzyme with NAD(P)H-hydrate epimerase domain